MIWLVTFFFFNDTATTEIYTLSLHDALPISNSRAARRRWLKTPQGRVSHAAALRRYVATEAGRAVQARYQDRKSTRLNSSHSQISYAVFCLKKKKVYTSQFIFVGYATCTAGD